MSTGDTVPPVMALFSLPTASDSTMSSPLSEVKDADPDEMYEDQTGTHGAKHDASDSTSNLSDIHSDPQESEAETDRLFDSPQKPVHHKDVFVNRNNEARIFERSPSKLQQEITLEASAVDEDDSHLEPLDSPSGPSRPPAHSISVPRSSNEDSTTRHPQGAIRDRTSIEKGDHDRKKRKRPVVPDDSDSDTPLRKRTSSVQALETNGPVPEAESPSELATLSHTRTHENSTVEYDTIEQSDKIPAKPLHIDASERIEYAMPDVLRSKRRKRGNTRKRKGPAETDRTDGDQGPDTHNEEGEHTTNEEAADDQPEVDGETEAEIVQKTEELEKKRMAFDQLAAIEKHFAAFRDKLYEERLEQLNKEEAMLRSDAPTHPEYLAMMQCVDARLQERLQHVECHLSHDTESLNTWAVSRRAQIMAQYHQGIRASRERVLSELGQQWYEIQHDRRRHANSTMDFGIRFPVQKPLQIRNAVAYNREVSILAGVAKYQGFPAAPELPGAAPSEVDEDFDAITSLQIRQPQLPVVNQFREYSVTNRVLGPAGEQFIEQTPWANPNHPSHQAPRNQNAQEAAPVPRRQMSQQNPFEIQGSVPGFSNGSTHKANLYAGRRDSEPAMTAREVPSIIQATKGGTKPAADVQGAKRKSLTTAAMA